MAEIFGDTWVETARDKLVALLNALKTTMATGYSPTFSYVYEHHRVAKLQLNAVSVDLVEAGFDWVDSYTGNPTNMWRMVFSVRCHTGHDGDFSDGQAQARLLASVVNKLLANNNLGNNFKLDTVRDSTIHQVFSESATIGAECKVEVLAAVSYTQE